MNSSHEINMTRGRLLPKLLRFILPLMCSSMLQIAFNAADLIVVGRFGRPTALAAVGSNGSLVALVVNVFLGLGTGGCVLAARYFGAQDTENLRKTVSTTVLVGVAGGALVGAFGAAVAEPLLRLMGSPDDVLPLAAVYLRIYFAGMPALALYNFSSAALRAVGDTRRPLLYLFLAGALNVALNLFFVLVVGIDVAGVAIATVISQCVSGFLTARALLRTERLGVRDLRFHGAAFREMMRVGLPAGIQGSMFSIANVIIQSSVNSFGAAVIAGNAAAVSIESFLYCPQDACQQAAMTAVSQNMGAGEYGRTKKAVWECTALVVLVSVVLSAAALLLSRPLLRLYTADEAALAAGVTRMRVVITLYFLNGLMNMMSGAIRGHGYSTLPAVVTFLGVCAFRILWIFTMFAAYHTLEWLYVSYPISWALTAAAHYVCYFCIRQKAFRKDALRRCAA